MHDGPRIVVVGSLVVDHIVEVPRLPRLHETLVSTRSSCHLGGKGFNQALTAARLGARVTLVGAAGDDDGFAAFREVLARDGVEPRVHLDAAGTGLAFPMVLPEGHNAIVLLPRANHSLSPSHVEAAADAFHDAALVLLQHEVPVAASVAAARLSRERGAVVVVNPAPAREDADELLSLADWLVPNEVEASALTGVDVRDADSALAAAERLVDRVRAGVVVTLGAAGSVALERNGMPHRVPARSVRAVDPTGAGDAFCGAFAVALGEGRPVAEALRFASSAGAFAVTRRGAEPGLPRRAELERLELDCAASSARLGLP